MIRQFAHPAPERTPGRPSAGGGGPAFRAPGGSLRFDQLDSVEGFCVEWQLMDSSPIRDGGGTPRAGGGRTA